MNGILNLPQNLPPTKRTLSVKIAVGNNDALRMTSPKVLFQDLTALFSDLCTQLGQSEAMRILQNHPLGYRLLEVLP